MRAVLVVEFEATGPDSILAEVHRWRDRIVELPDVNVHAGLDHVADAVLDALGRAPQPEQVEP